MKVFMIGGTGLLGCEAARVLIERGHQVTTVALPPLPEGAPIPKEMEIIFGDINKKTDDEIREMAKGCDVFIFAAGVDERVEFPAPVYEYYYKYNIAPLKRILPICKEMGLKRAVVLGSYFSGLAKSHPEMPICEHNPYIKSRIDQENVCKSFADDTFDVSVLELPYIFGTQPGRRPVWVILIEQIAFMDKWPFTMYPKGGTTMLTAKQVGQTIAGAAEKEVHGFKAWPIGMYNMTWKEFLSIVYDARGMGADHKIIGVPAWMMQMGMGRVVKDYKKRGIDSGMDPMFLPKIMNMNLFTDKKYCLELGVQEDDIKAAIFDSIKLSEEAYKGTAKLLEMKGE